MQNLYTAAQVREMDRLAIQTIPVAGFELMQRAGLSVFNELQSYLEKGSTLHIFCGAGNNGGDGYVVAMLALKSGLTVNVYALAKVDTLKNDALLAYESFQKAGGFISEIPEVIESGVIVDALFGTGLDREVSGSYLQVIDLINKAKVPVVAVDIASGLQADTGKIMGTAVCACKTVSFIGLKRGLYTADGPAMSGDIVFDDLMVGERIISAQQAEAVTVSLSDVELDIKPRSKNTHKGDFGHVLLVGGDKGFSGAIRLAGEAALRSGSGLVSIATHTSHAAFINASRPELMCHGVESRQQLTSLAKKANVIGLGPGLAQSSWSVELYETAVSLDKPMVIDADGLNLLVESPVFSDQHILTPHPGEAARLLNCSISDIQQNRFSAIKLLQEKYGGVVVLKGSGSLLYDGDGTIEVCQTGNPGMASGGMGDVLTGVIASLVGQGYTLKQAARLGMVLHGAAADIAAEVGEAGLIASDLFEPLRLLINKKV
jgi:NAD(P)H-hydrate epimerase